MTESTSLLTDIKTFMDATPQHHRHSTKKTKEKPTPHKRHSHDR